MCFLYIYGCVFPKLGLVFFYNLIEDLVYAINLEFFSLICTYNLMVCSIWGVPHFLDASCLDLLFYSTDTHVYFCYNTMLVMFLWLCDLPWDKICWYFKLYRFFPPEDCFGNPGSSVLTDEFQDSILNVKNSIGILIQIVLVR